MVGQEKDFMEKYTAYQQLRAELDARIKQREMITSTITEITNTISVLEDVKKLNDGQEMVIPLGSGTFVSANLKQTDKVLMDLGSDTFVKKSIDGSVDALKSRNEELQKALETLSSDLVMLETRINELGAEIEKLSAAANSNISQK